MEQVNAINSTLLEPLDPRKASGPDRIPNWLLKEYCDLVAYPIMKILNNSYPEQHLPTTWKIADVTSLSQKKQMVNIKKELRLTALTSCVSTVAEEFVVGGFVKPAVLSVLDEQPVWNYAKFLNCHGANRHAAQLVLGYGRERSHHKNIIIGLL